jgi:putative FmdB family regulatory protein
MAMYVYRCLDCMHEQAENFPMGTAPTDVRCLECGGDARRKFTPPATVIK